MTQRILLVSHTTGKHYLVEDASCDFHSTEGIVRSKDLLDSTASVVMSSKKVRFSKITPSLADLREAFARGPQIITEKDVGYILAKTAVNSHSVCVDAGAGTGALTLALANVCKEVVCYDVNMKHVKVVEKNVALLGATNVTVKHGDVARDLVETDVDLITLDLPNPQVVLPKVEEALQLGGWLVVYLPNIVQMKTCLDALASFKSLKLMELTELSKRNWKVEKEILRPVHTQIVHTGFLAFVRKL